MDVAAWLRGLGLERYAEAFRANDIGADILPDLTAEDLAALGVTSVGHRRKLLAASAALRPGAAPGHGRAAETTPGSAPASVAPPRFPDAERRQLTVMFADLVGSTELAARLDPEDLRDVIRAYHAGCAAVIERFEGHVAKFLGDGVLAYFGYPRAHEDAAERAVRAGLTLVEAVAGLRPRSDAALRVRVGIATGLVVVGDLLGSGPAEEQAVVGETPNLAARLQALAEPDSVVIAPGTRRLVAGLFDLADLGAHHLKGFAAPVPAWRVLGPSRTEGRFEAREAAGLTSLVGREQELALLLDRWQQAKEGEGQVVLLSGEPGIGKSRLVRALRERLAGGPHAALRYQCSPYHTSSALHPVIDQLERAAGFERGDTAEAKLGKLEHLLARSATDIAAAAPLFAALLSIPTEGRYPPLNLSPQRQKERTFEALLAQLEGLAAAEPVLMVFEDIHWIDPTTLELLERTVDRVPSLPVLLLATCRPEIGVPWAGDAHVTALTLARLGRRQVAAMVERVTGGRALPGEVVEQVVAKTDGVPLYVEELTKAVLESGLLRDAGDRYELTGPLPPLAIPATLHDSLLARLDRLASARRVAQIGAAIGREFSYELLAAVAPLPEAGLEAALDQLTEAGLVFRRGSPPHASYTFKHALVQDAAYATLLRSRRQQLHARIAAAIADRSPEIVEKQPELLARHFTEAGILPAAIDYWQRAGERAIQRSANTEAIGHFTKGLELLKILPDGPERAQRELALQTRLGAALVATRGFAAAEVEAVYSRARQVSQQLGDPSKVFSAMRGLWVYDFIRGDLHAAHGLADQLLELARREDRSDYLLEAHRTSGQTLLYLGDFAGSRAHLEQGLGLYDPKAHHAHIYLYGNDPGVVCSSYLAYGLWFLGHPDQALRRSREALARARQLAHPFTLVFALAFAAYLHQHLRDVPATRTLAEEAMAISTDQGFPFWANQEMMLRGWALAQQGHPEDGIAQLRKGLNAYRAMGSGLACPWFLALLAEAHAQSGRVEEGLKTLDEALAIVERSGERFYVAELHRLQGELTIAQRGPAGASDAEACYRRALDIAHGQGAISWELRTAISLAQLWHDLGQCKRASNLLTAVYGRCPEILTTAELARARDLLDRPNRT